MTAAPTLRFERYREVHRGDARPVIERCELVAPQGVDPLSLKLTFLPYFGETKPDTTLGAFLEEQEAHAGSAQRALFPSNLEGCLRHPAEERRQFRTLVEPQSQYTDLLVVRRGDARWYVDEVFYRIESLSGWASGARTDVVEGRFEDFRRFSPLVQLRLHEGLPWLAHPEAAPARSAEDHVLELSKSPGLPNTRSFSLTVFRDGRFLRRSTLEGEQSGADVHRLTTLLIAASRLAPIQAFPMPPGFAHDAQTLSVSFPVARGLERVTLDENAPADVLAFARQVAAAYGLEF
ncbi:MULTISPECIES: hypothetical protein [unclassified Myxococcus]|uniref:hypothetical protein n=1 Tax=unclassified Myxococcus TaxID=2648731 RepID=UPI001CBA77D6|nr:MULTISPECIES: hypothetical protein [unclassified Myxococcus]MBZ4398899.1 hypothetical protein [Myxococcus sp. AS-1-15]MBZ4407161.1 hypothetical protein [Myxococcus sp. XM-1-1-1]